MHRRLVLALWVLPLLVMAGSAMAQPADAQARTALNGPALHLIVPFTAGGSADGAARIIAPPLAQALGRPIIIENRPGAAGVMGAEIVARAPPDGHILGISTTSPLGIAPLMQGSMPYDSNRDFTHIALLAETPSVLLVPITSRFHSFEEYLRAAASWTRGLTFGSTGVGSLQHLQGDMLAKASGARLTHVPYRGIDAALIDLLAGALDSAFSPLAGLQEALATGRIRILAVSSPAPFSALPGVPTYAALGYPQLTATSWVGISGPRDLPPALVEQVNGAANRVLQDPEVVRRLVAVGLFPPATPLSAASYQQAIAQFGAKWAPVVKASGLQSN
jgi:tripartite-type tricarboxylate transporter receptor subunit TctC